MMLGLLEMMEMRKTRNNRFSSVSHFIIHTFHVELYSLTQSMENGAEHKFHGWILDYDSFRNCFLLVLFCNIQVWLNYLSFITFSFLSPL